MATAKVLSVLPPAARTAAEALALYAPAWAPDDQARARLQTLREAVQSRHMLRLGYRDLSESSTQRTVRPLGCVYWGGVWTLAAWCDLRDAFRSFRVDRIETIEASGERFRDEPGKTLAEMLRSEKADRVPPSPSPLRLQLVGLLPRRGPLRPAALGRHRPAAVRPG